MEITKEKAEPEAVRWLRDDYLPALGGNKTAAAAELGMSHKVLNALLCGTYVGNIERQLAKLDEQRVRLSAQVRGVAAGVDLRHIPTRLMQRIFRAADAAKVAGICVQIAGQPQIGKTTAAEAYKKAYPETTILMEMPVPANTGSVMYELGRACGVDARGAGHTKFGVLRQYLSARHLVIVDEAHCALETAAGLRALEVLRKLHNATHCAMLYIYTPDAARRVVRGRDAGKLLQLDRRGEWEMLPDVPSSRDVQAIWEAYGLPEPDAETQRAIGAMVRATCFGQYTHRLRLAYGMAQVEGREFSWRAFMEASARMSRRPE